jgi:hypothetical protein
MAIQGMAALAWFWHSTAQLLCGEGGFRFNTASFLNSLLLLLSLSKLVVVCLLWRLQGHYHASLHWRTLGRGSQRDNQDT